MIIFVNFLKLKSKLQRQKIDPEGAPQRIKTHDVTRFDYIKSILTCAGQRAGCGVFFLHFLTFSN
jgi:hypothetical protein